MVSFDSRSRLVVLTLALVLTACQRNSAPTGNTAASGSPNVAPLSAAQVVIPGADPNMGACAAQSFDLRTCLAFLIETKREDVALTIDIAPGRYELRGAGGLLIFQKKNILIRGAAGPNGESATHIFLDPHLASNVPAVLQSFVQIIDSSGITITDLSIDGSNLRFHGFSVCPLGGDDANPTHDIVIQRVTARNFTNFFTIVGAPLGHTYLHGSRSLDPSTNRLNAFTGMVDEPENPRQFCEGDIHRMTFADNHLFLKSVGFYGAPLMLRQTRNFTGLRPPFLVEGEGPNARVMDWEQVLRQVAGRNSDWVIRNNQFIVDLKPDFPDYEKQLGGYLHSAIKVQGMANLTIDHNIIDSRSNSDTFLHGAAINIAFDMSNVAIRENKLLFADDYKHPSEGLVIESGFIFHIYYGSGAITYSEQNGRRIPFLNPEGESEKGKLVDYGAAGLAGPALNVHVEGNEFNNTSISIVACCANTLERNGRVLGWANAGDFCRDMDAHQGPGEPKRDDLVLRNNAFHYGNPNVKKYVGGLPTHAAQPTFVGTFNDKLRREHPEAPVAEAEYCRQRMSVLDENNRIQ